VPENRHDKSVWLREEELARVGHESARATRVLSPDVVVQRPRGAVRSRVAKKFREVRRALSDADWTKVRHAETWRSPDGETSITVAGKDSDTVPVGTLGAIRRATGLEHLR
jgi:hypothetical protein